MSLATDRGRRTGNLPASERARKAEQQSRWTQVVLLELEFAERLAYWRTLCDCWACQKDFEADEVFAWDDVFGTSTCASDF